MTQPTTAQTKAVEVAQMEAAVTASIASSNTETAAAAAVDIQATANTGHLPEAQATAENKDTYGTNTH